tara:strand:- start:4388 stop:6628 length:2241 start_codon:yes stop_codon:yes gene_type:complete
MSILTRKYKPFQLKPIEYMAQKCPQNDGIFLYHYMGTGKSYTAIGIAHNLGNPFLIICPQPLVNQWLVDYVNVYEKHLPKNIGVFSFTDAAEFLEDKDSQWFSDKTLIMDECHNLSHHISTLKINKLQSFKKRIVLSATPIYNSACDISYIINVAGGSNIFPIDNKVFREKYYRVFSKKSMVYGWVANNLKNLVSITLATQLIASFGMLSTLFNESILDKLNEILGDKGTKLWDTVSPLGSKYVVDSSHYFLKIITAPTLKVLKYIGINTVKPVFTFLNSKILDDYTQKEISDFGHEAEKAFFNYWKSGRALKADDLGAAEELTERMAGSRMVDFMLSWCYLWIATIIVYFLTKAYSDAKYNDGKETYFEPDFTKIKEDLGPYISYYSPNFNDADFPKIIDKQIYKSLNHEQICILMRFTIAKLTFEDYLSLGIFNNYDECEELMFDQSNRELFLNYGRFIGNICKFTDDNGTPEYLIDKILYYSEEDLRCYLNLGYTFSTIASKYISIAKYRSKNPEKKIVIYTSSSLASKTLSAYLSFMNIDNQLLENGCSPDRFKKILKNYYNRTSILILDSGYYEGVSILKTDTMFILEPINNVSKNLQARARIVRLDSHPPGSTVQIINILSTMDIISRNIGSLKAWAQTSRYVMFNYLYTEHNQNVTPDMIIYNKQKKLAKENNKLIEILKKSAIEFIDLPKKCYPIDCKIGELYESSNCAKVNLGSIAVSRSRKNVSKYNTTKKEQMIK